MNFSGVHSPGPISAFGPGNGPAKTSVIRIGRTASVLVPPAFHALPALFFTLELHHRPPENMVYYTRSDEFYKPQEVRSSVTGGTLHRRDKGISNG